MCLIDQGVLLTPKSEQRIPDYSGPDSGDETYMPRLIPDDSSLVFLICSGVIGFLFEVSRGYC